MAASGRDVPSAGEPPLPAYAVRLERAGRPRRSRGSLRRTCRRADIRDFGDTAVIIAPLDLVISVDTSVAHVAAAMGKPVWLLDRFHASWRWRLARRHSPWHPSLRIFRRHRFLDRSHALDAVAAALAAFAAARTLP